MPVATKFLIAVLSGIIISQNIVTNTIYVLIFSFSTLSLSLFFLFLLKKIFINYENLIQIILFALCISCGIILKITNNNIFINYTDVSTNHNIIKLLSDAEYKNNKYRYKAEILDISAHPNIFIYVKDNNSRPYFKKNDVFYLKNNIQVIENKSNAEFDFKLYCFRNNIGYATFIEESNLILLKAGKTSLSTFFNSIQQSLVEKLSYYAPDSVSLSIAAAISLGYNNLTDETREIFSSTGAIHVLCVSGLHVSTIFVLFSFIFKPVNAYFYRRYIVSLLSLLALWVYAAITGFSPSVVRATLMLSFVLLGTLFSKDVLSINILCCAALLITIINPNSIFNLGFLLSHLAVLGINLFNSIINEKLKLLLLKPKSIFSHKCIKKFFCNIIDLVSVSLSVQLLLTPFLIYYFHKFPCYFLITNIIVIPLATFILYCGIFFFAFTPIPFVANIISKILYLLIKIMTFTVAKVYVLPASILKINNFHLFQVFWFFLCVIYLISFLRNKFPARKAIALLLLIIVFIISFVINDFIL